MNALTTGLARYLDETRLQRIRQTKVGIAGAGGLGSNCAQLLVRSGFIDFVLVDFDVVECSNLNRQFFFQDQIGQPKVQGLADNLRQINPDVSVRMVQARITPESVDTIFADCGVVIEAMDTPECKQMLAAAYSRSGKLLVGSITAAAPTYLSAAMIALKEEYPLLSIEIVVDTSDRLVRMLRDGTLDVVIGRMPVANGSLEQDCLFHSIGGEVIVMVASADHPLLRPAKKQISFKALLSYPWILQPRGSPSREVIEQELLAHHAAPPLGLVETTSILVAANLLAFENMIAAIPLSIARPYEQHGILKILPYAFKHTLTDWGCIVHRDRTVGPTTQEFLRLMSSRC